MSVKFNNTAINNINFNNTPICKLKYNGTLVWENHAYGSWTTTTAATCTTAGSKKRTCTRTGCGCSETETIFALGHNWSDTSYMWDTSTANPSCTAVRSCSNVTHEGDNFESAAGIVTSNITNATCTATGLKAYTAKFTVPWASQRYKEETIDKLAHNEVLDVSVVATCTTAGKTAGSHCSVCNTVIIPQTPIKALGHSWGTPSYAWNTDYTSCRASRACTRDYKHIQTAIASALTGDITSQTTAATCTTDGKTVYIATFPSGEWQPLPQTKEVTITATGHDWNDLFMYTWADDLSTCTAERTCKNDSTHISSVNGMVTSEVTTAATCTKAGVRTYTAIFPALSNGVTPEKRTRTQSIPATGVHSWKAATYTAPKTCTVCGATEGSALTLSKPNIAASVEKGLKSGRQTYDKITVTLNNPNSAALAYTISYSCNSASKGNIPGKSTGTVAAKSSITDTSIPIDPYELIDTTFSECTIEAYFDVDPSKKSNVIVSGSDYVPESTSTQTTQQV